MKKVIFVICFIILHYNISYAQGSFKLYQLPSQVNAVGNSYVIQTAGNKVVVIDGGTKGEELYLRGFLAALGNEVDAWFVSHPHEDHIGALTQILLEPQGIVIKKLYESRFPNNLIELEEQWKLYAYDYYKALDATNIPILQIDEPGLEGQVDELHFKILGVTNPEITVNPYNNSSMVIRMWDSEKSIVFLGDAGVECGQKLLESTFRADLNCDYLQMAHHGQQGCDEDFYTAIEFEACLWPTPLWVWNNDLGEGYNTGPLTTLDTRKWMEKKGVKKHYISHEQLWVIE